jgi:hypothetical protein
MIFFVVGPIWLIALILFLRVTKGSGQFLAVLLVIVGALILAVAFFGPIIGGLLLPD